MTRAPEPLTEEGIRYWRKEVAKGHRDVHDWPDDDVMEVVGRFLATLDAAREPLPTGYILVSEAELAAALGRVGDDATFRPHDPEEEADWFDQRYAAAIFAALASGSAPAAEGDPWAEPLPHMEPAVDR